jgi:hypothetical protein
MDVRNPLPGGKAKGVAGSNNVIQFPWAAPRTVCKRCRHFVDFPRASWAGHCNERGYSVPGNFTCLDWEEKKR